MNKSYSFTVLFIMVAVLAFGIAMVSADDAEAAQYDVELKYMDGVEIKILEGMNPVIFNYTVRNTGDNPSMEVYLQLEEVPSLWNVFFSADPRSGTEMGTYVPSQPFDFLLQKAEKCNFTMTITSAPNQLNKTYDFKLNAWPRKDPGRNDSHTVGVVITQIAGFEIGVWNPPPNGVYLAIPPSTVTVRFALFNTGNGVDRFLVRGHSSRSEAGWTISFDSGVDEFGFTPNISADPLKQRPHFIDVKVPIPAGERAHVTAHITINATSMFNVTKQMPPAFAQISSLQYYNFQVYVNGPDKKDGTPGEEVEFQLKINNQGNGWDTFSIKPVWDTDLNPGFIASANPRAIDIDLNDNGTVQYIVKVPTNAPKKTYFFTAEIESSSPELSPVTKSFAVEVGQYFAIQMEAPVSRASTIPGGNLEFEVTVRNTGNGLDSIVIQKIKGAPDAWLTYTQPPEVTLLQDAEAIIKIIVIIPSKFEEAPIGSYNLTVPAISSRSDASAEFSLIIDITQFYRIEWLYQGEEITNPDRPEAQLGSIRPRRSFNPYEKNSIDITLEVKNFGNGGDNITMSGYSTDPRITVEITPEFTLLFRDQIKYVKVHIEVPENIPHGVYVVYANASSQDITFIERVVPLDFEVENYDARVPAIPTYIDPDMGDVVRSEVNVKPNSNLSFKLKIENNGTRPLSAVTVRVYDNYYANNGLVTWNFFNFTTPPIAVGDRYIVGERPYSKTNPPLYWWSNRSGSHNLVFKIFYEAQAEVTNDISDLNVTVEKEAGGSDSITQNAYLMGTIIAVVIAVVIVAGYVFALRRKPQVDADLYSSIYGGDFDEEVVAEVPAEAAPEAEPAMSPEQQALYGDDYVDDGADYDDEEYDYDYENGEYADGDDDYGHVGTETAAVEETKE